MNRKTYLLLSAATLWAVPAGAQFIPAPGSPARTPQAVVTTTTTTNKPGLIAPPPPPMQGAPVQPVSAAPLPTPQPAAAAPPSPATASPAETAFTQAPAYQECSALARTNPIAAEQKANAWLQIDDSVGAHHCRAMAFYGQRRFAEAAQALTVVRGKISPGNIVLRSFVVRQASKAWMEAGRPDAAVTALNDQINDMATVRGQNAEVSRQTSALLLERARLRVTYGQLDEAVKDLDHAVSLTPTDEAVLMQRAQAFAQLNDLELAKLDVASVLKLNPRHAKAQELQRLLNNPNAPQ